MRVRRRPDLLRLQARYVSGDETIKEIATSEGVSAGSLYQASQRMSWAARRQEWREEQAQDDMDAEADERKRRRKQAVQMAYSAKILVFKRLMQRMKNPQYLPTVQEFALIQRLERDLDEPGWNKSEAEKSSPTVNMNIGIDQVLERVKKAREAEIIDVEDVNARPAKEIASFMFAEEEDDYDGDN